ncbi:hypothetical protein [Streptomyces scopuliridis]|uniref:PLL-like beta propeller domain-containing protein n=1 Tax=Streptomyces scopuliridis RB72 TaxID=1440053 RepID=A0A2T7T522_9ACTN|nr:hypothetical protein [Streptomyces scopuliridis]PVE10232.1 hypothetical protein Y717_04745 [Streptomyces scopuliridis RB72]
MTTPGTVWGAFLPLGGALVNDPAVVARSDGRLVVLAEGRNHTLVLIRQNRDLSWSPWTELPGARISGVPAAILGRDRLLRVLWRTPGDELFAGRIPGESGTRPVRVADGVAGDPAAVLNADGRISVFYRGTDHTVRSVSHTSVAYAVWAPAATIGGAAEGVPCPVLAADGRVAVFVRGGDGELWIAEQRIPDTTSDWTPFERLARTPALSAPKAALDADGRIRVFWQGRDGAGCFLGRQGDYAAWNPEGTLKGGLAGAPYPFRSSLDGRLQIFAAGPDHALWVAGQKTVNSDQFTDFAPLNGALAGAPVPACHSDGRISVFVRGTDGVLRYVTQNWAP